MFAFIFELLFEFVFEIVIEFVAEVLSEIGLNFWDKARGSSTLNPIILVVGYAIFGTILGAISYFVLPASLNFGRELRIASLIISPIVMGFMLCLVSYFVSRRDRNEPFFSAAKFVQGVVFGLSYSLTRAALV